MELKLGRRGREPFCEVASIRDVCETKSEDVRTKVNEKQMGRM